MDYNGLWSLGSKTSEPELEPPSKSHSLSLEPVIQRGSLSLSLSFLASKMNNYI
jgi:hypothetical protein